MRASLIDVDMRQGGDDEIRVEQDLKQLGRSRNVFRLLEVRALPELPPEGI